MASYLVGAVGALLTLILGVKLGLSPAQALLCIGAANIAAVWSGILTLRAEKVRWLKASFLRGWIGTWACLALLFFTAMVAVAFPLREPRVLQSLAIPLILSTGLCIRSVFGPLQDWMVRRAQKNR